MLKKLEEAEKRIDELTGAPDTGDDTAFFITVAVLCLIFAAAAAFAARKKRQA